MGCVGPLLNAYAINKMLFFQVAQSGGPSREKKTDLFAFKQHIHSLISAFIVCFLESIITCYM